MAKGPPSYARKRGGKIANLTRDQGNYDRGRAEAELDVAELLNSLHKLVALVGIRRAKEHIERHEQMQ
ncbi:MAG: hypothetical protein K8U57_12690 [Planctomycetes bacterium]|nr:hypothetical protein [Planctomycetota bacterium]